MTIDEPSAQLFDDLDASVQDALATGRPVLHHLNADSSWLLQLPRPESAIKHGGRVYYNILLDPWLSGPQSDLASWFSQQFHATRSAISTIAELEELARDTEIAALKLRAGSKRKSNAETDRENGSIGSSFVDAVAISHEFTDHCHKDTLLELDKDVPIFAVKQAAALVKGWNYFRTVVAMPDFGKNGDTDWRSTSLSPLPEWVGISRLLSKEDQLDYHSAVMITWNNRRHGVEEAHIKKLSSRKRHHDTIEPNEDDESAEALIYTPHGVQADSIDVVPAASPPIRPLAFLHGQHNVKISSTFGTALQLNLGSHNGLAAQRKLNAKYWIGTHDEVKRGGGVVAWFLQRTVITVKDALEQEARRLRDDGEPPLKSQKVIQDPDGVLETFKDCNWLELRNGESRVLA